MRRSGLLGLLLLLAGPAFAAEWPAPIAKSRIGVMMFQGSIGAWIRPIRPSAQMTPMIAVTSGTIMPWSVRNAR